MREETGLEVEVERIVGIYSDPKHVFAYDDGEVRQEFSICFACRRISGDLDVSDESYEVRYFAPDAVTDLPMVDCIRLRITDFLDGSQPAIR